MKKSLPINIESPISVTPQDIQDAEKIEQDTLKLLQLVDLIMFMSEHETIYS